MRASKMTSKQKRFCQEFLVDGNGAAAAVRAGYAAGGSAKVAAHRMLTKDNRVRGAIKARQDADSERLNLSRDKVLKQLLEAADMARETQDAIALISAARELGKMLGYYVPEVKKVLLTAGQRAIKAEFAALSEDELLAIIEQERAEAH